ncbi:hypothetical protein GA0070622_0066 [Micromonospora sediminicola]|uniref:DUF4913 domain-containing protein n=1 Tax=Micromonospora sediminicola TaxID=946078 RepID=A0A1A9B1W6_9ACTN|nr:hypothetical protein [Micromonospora sediminicola]SBT63113.1 hypothetical protein GA0070622_0054 [Micromonospora sediminicola]SBT63125.1 hypothetical protein GA0070622_0066 [Micromonospora sediminicola]
MTTQTNDPASAATVRALAAEVEAVSLQLPDVYRQVEAVQEVADAAQRGVVVLAEAIERLRAAGGSSETGSADDHSKPTPSWLTIDDPGAAAAALGELAEWLRTVYVRYSGAALGDCWLWHPDVVTELLALREAWISAYQGPRASAETVMDWHDRYRPGTVARVNAALGRCYLQQHLATGELSYSPARLSATEQVADIARWWATSHGDTAAPPPSPNVVAESAAARSTRSTY